MSLLTLCTLTGADDRTEQQDLFKLSLQYPFVEWGVLFHATHQGHGRYPSLEWIDALRVQRAHFPNAKFALHICGHEALQDFMHGVGSVSRLVPNFTRVQLNLRASAIDPKVLAATLAKHPATTFITQHNLDNAGLWKDLREVRNHAILFDESGGRGIRPLDWSAPLPEKHCGYAGGLGPDNLEHELKRVEFAAQGRPFWIDMEGKLRDKDDAFDLSVARRCLSIVARYLGHVSAG